MSDPVNHPAHYTQGRFEAIDVIEDAVSRAPDAVLGGCQWQALKYLLRLWDKGNPGQDAAKARWYLNRLIDHLERADDPRRSPPLRRPDLAVLGRATSRLGPDHPVHAVRA